MAALGHQRARSLLAPFAVDAVDSIERELVAEHLAHCDACAAELLTLADAATDIDRAQPRPPERVWSGISQRVAKPPIDVAPTGAGGDRSSVVKTRQRAVTELQSVTEVERLTAEATKQLLWIDDERDAVDIVVRLIESLGGSVVPATVAPDGVPDSLPVDISFGACAPLLPVAPAMSVARLYLEEVLPGVLEDARRAVAIARARRRRR